MKESQTSRTRLIAFRDLLGHSQSDFAEMVGITQGALSQLETGKSKLSLDTIVKISRTFGVNCNWLINGQGHIFLVENTEVSEAAAKDNNGLADTCMIPLVMEEAHAGYIKNCQDVAYLKTLDVYKIPGYEQGNYRLFEIAGDSMLPTIHPREIVIAEQIDDWKRVENGTLCIVISEDGIVAKRVYFYAEDPNVVILKSDNTDFRTYSIAKSEIIEMWGVRAKITSVFAQDHVADSRKLQALEMDLQTLREQVQKLSQRPSEADAEGN